MMDFFLELVVVLLIVTSGTFGLIGSYGLAKLPDLMTRLHAPTKATTLGVGGALLASMFHFAFQEGDLSLHELLITLFLFLTAPITANMVAKAYLLTSAGRKGLPPTGRRRGWATFEGPSATDGDEPDTLEAARREP